jgi:hypothetical protein
MWSPGIERGDGTVAGPQEAVSSAACVSVVSRDCSRRIDGGSEGALEKACASGWGIERDVGSGFRRILRA